MREQILDVAKSKHKAMQRKKAPADRTRFIAKDTYETLSKVKHEVQLSHSSTHTHPHTHTHPALTPPPCWCSQSVNCSTCVQPFEFGYGSLCCMQDEANDFHYCMGYTLIPPNMMRGGLENFMPVDATDCAGMKGRVGGDSHASSSILSCSIPACPSIGIGLG